MDTATKWATEFIEMHTVPPLLHGDEQHQAWLRAELQKWIPALADLLLLAALNDIEQEA